ncbi:MAG TPA: serine/threonine-protein kinase [Bryobacteraceae bacterium]|nr:serine/threonine-protein kinase [Bryobacteraceae bacterium]
MGFHVGEDLGDYKIVAIVGAGSMGRVFQVEHRLTKRKEAVKVLSAELATQIQIQRFQREIALQARLSHPHIATVHNAISWEGCLVLVTEFLEGQTLEKLLCRGRIPIDTGIEYVRQTLSALAYAHDQGIVHRDVSPANLIITGDGNVKLTDFGLSKSFGDPQLTNHGDIVGSVDYMAPEQASDSAHTDGRSDLYSVGAILYEVLTGKKPFGARRKFGPFATDSESAPPRPTDLEPALRPEWNDVIAKALRRDPEQRYASASEFLEAIEQVAPASVRVAALAGADKRSRFPVAKASLAAAAMLLLAAGLVRFWRVPPPAGVIFHIPPPQAETISQSIAATLTAIQPRTGKPPATGRRRSQSVKESSTNQPEPPAPAPRKGFWSKLNPFRKRPHSAP